MQTTTLSLVDPISRPSGGQADLHRNSYLYTHHKIDHRYFVMSPIIQDLDRQKYILFLSVRCFFLVDKKPYVTKLPTGKLISENYLIVSISQR